MNLKLKHGGFHTNHCLIKRTVGIPYLNACVITSKISLINPKSLSGIPLGIRLWGGFACVLGLKTMIFY